MNGLVFIFHFKYYDPMKMLLLV